MDSKSRAAAVASTADEAVAAAKELGSEVVVKIQAWTTGRAGIGGVAFAKKPEDVRAHAERMLAMKVGQFPVEAVLVEEKIDIDREFFLSFAIDDAARAPMIIFAAGGGTGIEERAAATRRIPCDVNRGPLDSAVDEAVASCGLSAKNAKQLNESIRKLFAAARSVEARSLEINPLVLTKSGEFVAADCRITIDDYAVGAASRARRSRLHVSSIIRRRLSSRSLTPSNKTIIAAHSISHSWQRRHRKDPRDWSDFTAQAAAAR